MAFAQAAGRHRQRGRRLRLRRAVVRFGLYPTRANRWSERVTRRRKLRRSVRPGAELRRRRDAQDPDDLRYVERRLRAVDVQEGHRTRASSAARTSTVCTRTSRPACSRRGQRDGPSFRRSSMTAAAAAQLRTLSPSPSGAEVAAAIGVRFRNACVAAIGPDVRRLGRRLGLSRTELAMIQRVRFRTRAARLADELGTSTRSFSTRSRPAAPTRRATSRSSRHRWIAFPNLFLTGKWTVAMDRRPQRVLTATSVRPRSGPADLVPVPAGQRLRSRRRYRRGQAGQGRACRSPRRSRPTWNIDFGRLPEDKLQAAR